MPSNLDVTEKDRPIIEKAIGDSAGLTKRTADEVIGILSNQSPYNQIFRDDDRKLVGYIGCDTMYGHYFYDLRDPQKTNDADYLVISDVYFSDETDAEDQGNSAYKELDRILKQAQKDTGICRVSIGTHAMKCFSPEELTARGFEKGTGLVSSYSRNTYTHEQQTSEWIGVLFENCEEAIDEIEKNLHLYHWLSGTLLACAKKGADPKMSRLYGILGDLHRWRAGIFDEEWFLVQKKVDLGGLRKIHKTEQNRQLHIRYARHLCEEFGLQESLAESLGMELYRTRKNRIKWDAIVRSFLTSRNCELDSEETYDRSYLDALFPENKEKTALGDFEEDGVKYRVFELHNMKHLKYETKILGHCIGDNDFYLDKIRNGEIRIFAVHAWDEEKQDYLPCWTCEYYCDKKQVTQMEGKDKSHPTQAHDAPVMRTLLGILSENEVDIQSVDLRYGRERRTLDYCLAVVNKDGGASQFVSFPSRFINISLFCSSGMDQIVGGVLKATKETNKKDIERVCQLPGVTIDMTDLDENLKQSITHVSGNIIDYCTSVRYANLRQVDGYVSFNSAHTISLPRLESIGLLLECIHIGHLILPDLITCPKITIGIDAIYDLPSLESGDAVERYNRIRLRL